MGAPQFQLKKSYLDPARSTLNNNSTRPNVPTEVCPQKPSRLLEQGAPSPGGSGTQHRKATNQI